MTEGDRMHTITTTMQPDVEIEVDDAEFLDLSRQGLIKEDRTAKAPDPEPDEQTTEPAPKPEETAKPVTTKKGPKGDA